MSDQVTIDRLLSLRESFHFDCKRIRGKVDKLLETVVAFANSEGGTIALGLEDPDKAEGRDRLYGVQECSTNWDELRRKLDSRITEPDDLDWESREIECTLRDGRKGSVVLLRILKSPRVHSIVDDGTYVRLEKGNREITAQEINELCFARGAVSAESQVVDVDFELLDTEFWHSYSRHRELTRPLPDALYHIGLAKRDSDGELKPTRAAVLLFAEHPSGVLGEKAAIRVFHYRGPKISTDPNTNLLRAPITIDGPVIEQIRDCRAVVLHELGERVQHGPLGFEIVQRYPVRVVAEAITNAVVHRDYRLTSDVLVRIFSDRIEVESPGLLAGPVTSTNISRIGTHARNPLLVQHLREFPVPPNLDAGEGVRMMFGTMREVGLYPPMYITRPRIEREAVLVVLRNLNRPTVWDQVCHHLDVHGSIRNAELRKLMQTSDTLAATKQLKVWVDQGLLIVANPREGKRSRRYVKPDSDDTLFSTGEEKNP